MKRLAGILLLFSVLCAAGRTRPEITLGMIKQKDLSMLWIGSIPMIDREDTTTLAWFERPEPLGYIGKDLQPFYLHIASVCRSATDPLKYSLSGKTRSTGNNVCNFEGELHMDSLVMHLAPDETCQWGGIYSGWYPKCRYILREDPEQPGAGVFEGTHTLDIAVDPAGNIYYDTLMLIADGYCNDQRQGNWSGYKTGATKVCNWGDLRIPESCGMDIGAGEFAPDPKYAPKGWQSYCDQFYHPDKEVQQRGRREESFRWWYYYRSKA